MYNYWYAVFYDCKLGNKQRVSMEGMNAPQMLIVYKRQNL